MYNKKERGAIMIAMQYKITLPSDYNMDIIRNRVSDKGYLADNLQGLDFKAFLISEKGNFSNNENMYAPFYVWSKDMGMIDVVLGDFFQGIITSFGWQKISNWIVLHSSKSENNIFPKYALQETITIPTFTDLKALREQEVNRNKEVMDNPHMKYSIVAFNPENWSLVRFQIADNLEDNSVNNSQIEKYEVLYLASPNQNNCH